MKKLLNLLKSWFRRSSRSPVIASEAQQSNSHSGDGLENLVPYDENLLERSRIQWQFGDWASLAALDRDTLQHHPDRAKLALLGAAGRLQTGSQIEAKQWIRLAQDWGCSKKLISQILIAGVHNNIGRASALSGNNLKSFQHFEAAISIGTPGADVRLLTQARSFHQLGQLNLNSKELNFIRE